MSNKRAKITYCTPSRLLWVGKRPFRTAGPDLEGLKSYGKSCLFFSMIFNIHPRNYFYTYLDISSKSILKIGFGILLPKLFWHTVRKKCSSDWEKLLKFCWRPRIWNFFEIIKAIYSNSERSEQLFGNRIILFKNYKIPVCSWLLTRIQVFPVASAK